VILYGGVDSRLDGAVELILRREDAERVVRAWDRDEPEDAGLLQVEVVDLELSPNDRGLEVRAVDRP
jgi:hypothetical protein